MQTAWGFSNRSAISLATPDIGLRDVEAVKAAASEGCISGGSANQSGEEPKQVTHDVDWERTQPSLVDPSSFKLASGMVWRVIRPWG